jgi:hypothetical protein
VLGSSAKPSCEERTIYVAAGPPSCPFSPTPARGFPQKDLAIASPPALTTSQAGQASLSQRKTSLGRQILIAPYASQEQAEPGWLARLELISTPAKAGLDLGLFPAYLASAPGSAMKPSYLLATFVRNIGALWLT